MKRRWWKIALVTVALLAVLVAAAPYAANWGPVRSYVAGRIAATLGRPVTLGELRARWGSGVTVGALEVKNAGPEFAGPGLLEARAIRVEDSLLGLVFGDGPSSIRIEGLVFRFETQAGGRTNLDDILTRFAEAPPRPPVEKPPPPRPLSVVLKDCTFEIKHLPRRDVAPVDPFTEDPEILPADAGQWRVGVERFDLKLTLGPDATEVDFKGGVTVNGKGGALDGSVRIAGKDISGRAKATGIDLSLAEPFLGRPIAGSLDVDMKGGAGGAAEVNARVRGLAAEGIAEDWVTLEAAGRRDGDGVQVDRLAVAAASGRLGVEAAGRWPPEAGADFRAEGRADLRLLADVHARAPRQGDVTFDLTGTRTETGADVRGSLVANGVVLPDPALKDAGPLDVRADFDLAQEGDVVTVRRLGVHEEKIHLSLKGTVGEDLVDLAGDARLDLARLNALLAAFLPEGVRLEGDVQVPDLHVRRDGTGDVALRAQARLADVVAAGLVEGEALRCDEGTLEVDADLTGGGDVLTVRKGRFNDLEATGRVVGLKREHIESAEGAVKGSLELTPLLLELAGTDALADLRGRVTLDVKGTTTDGAVNAEGRVELRDLYLKGAFGEVRQRSLVLTGGAAQAAGNTTADVAFKADRFDGSLKVDRFTKDEVKGAAQLNIADLAELRDLVPGVSWPEGLELRGAARIAAEGSRARDVLEISGSLEGPRLAARHGAYGFGEDTVNVSGRAARDASGAWSVPAANLTLRERRLAAAVEGGRLGPDGSLEARIRVTAGSLDRLAEVVPAVEPYALRGAADLRGLVRRTGATWTVDSGALVERFGARVEGREVTSGKLTLKAKGSLGGESGTVELLHVALDRAWVEMKGTLGATSQLNVRAGGELDAIAPFVPKLDGMGPFTADATVQAAVDTAARALADGPVRATGFLEGKRVAYDGARCDDGRVEFQVTARRAGEDWKDVASAVYVKAREARRDNLRFVDLEVNESGTGELLKSGKGAGYAFQPQVRARQLRIDDMPLENVVLSVKGNTKDDPFVTGGGDWTGKVRFARAALGPVVLTDGTGDLVLKDGVATLTALTATVNEGRVTVAGDFSLDKGPMRWHGTLDAKDVRVTEGLGRPLSFLVPIMRLKVGDSRRRLTGLVSAKLDFRGVGTTYASLSPSLSGKGSIGLRDIEVQGSLLLPLLSLRVDRLLTDRSYRFSDVNINFGIQDGRVRAKPFELKGEPFGIKLEGDAGLDGSLDFKIDPALLPVPLKVTGTLDKPKVRPDPLGRLPFR